MICAIYHHCMFETQAIYTPDQDVGRWYLKNGLVVARNCSQCQTSLVLGCDGGVQDCRRAGQELSHGRLLARGGPVALRSAYRKHAYWVLARLGTRSKGTSPAERLSGIGALWCLARDIRQGSVRQPIGISARTETLHRIHLHLLCWFSKSASQGNRTFTSKPCTALSTFEQPAMPLIRAPFELTMRPHPCSVPPSTRRAHLHIQWDGVDTALVYAAFSR